ncbi:MAG: hypothetical protein H7841_16210 [Magnetospirillum sp. WYHS-4]
MVGIGRLALAVTVGSLAFAASDGASAAGLGKSIASDLIQARAQQRILKEDDAADGSCHQRHFATAEVVRQPEVQSLGRIAETKWQEQWTLMRCGLPVGYRVFFTEVGLGGAYFSVVRTD